MSGSTGITIIRAGMGIGLGRILSIAAMAMSELKDIGIDASVAVN
jgi:hypothetical protein